MRLKPEKPMVPRHLYAAQEARNRVTNIKKALNLGQHVSMNGNDLKKELKLAEIIAGYAVHNTTVSGKVAYRPRGGCSTPTQCRAAYSRSKIAGATAPGSLGPSPGQ